MSDEKSVAELRRQLKSCEEEKQRAVGLFTLAEETVARDQQLTQMREEKVRLKHKQGPVYVPHSLLSRRRQHGSVSMSILLCKLLIDKMACL